MILGEMLESFYVDAGLTEEIDRAALAPQGDVETWLLHARLRLGCFEGRSELVSWAVNAVSIPLAADFVNFQKIITYTGYLPQYDLVAHELVFRAVSNSSGTGRVYYERLFPLQDDGSAPDGNATQDRACLAFVDYALSRFFRRLAASRVDYKRYSTVTGQAGLEASDLQSLADDHRNDFDAFRNELSLSPGASFYGD